MSKVSARRGLKSAQGFKARASGARLVVLPKPKKSWLLAGTALATGIVGGVVLAPTDALATCTIVANVVNCSGTFTGNGFDFAPTGDFDVNVLGSVVPANVAHITGDENNNPTLDITTGGNNGYFTFDEGTTFKRSGEDGGDEHVIVIDGGGDFHFDINGEVSNLDNSSGSATLRFDNGAATTDIVIDIGSTGMLGDDPNDLIVDVNSNISTTLINNWGEMNGRMDFNSGAGAVTVNNYSDDTWNTSGTTNYTNNSDLVNNEGGTLNTSGTLRPSTSEPVTTRCGTRRAA